MATYNLSTLTSSQQFVTGDILNCPYTGSVIVLKVNAGEFTLKCWGAQGGRGPNGSGESQSTLNGGKGGYSVGTLTLSSSTTIYIYVGGGGADAITKLASGYTGGFNGGGNGGSLTSTSNGTNGAGGGGASDIRIGQDSLYARVIVAGGGGGASWSSDAQSGLGGYGGGASGGSGKQYKSETAATGGTQTSGGSGGRISSYTPGASGSFGNGGTGANNSSSSINSGAGGGGGWYGGGGGGSITGGNQAHGGGGSGYVYRSATASNYPSGCLLNSSYYLKNAQTIAGNQLFASPSGSNETGHSGNGYIRITINSGSAQLIPTYTPSNLPETLCEGDIIQANYTGSVQNITLPKGIYKLECWGGSRGYVTNTDVINNVGNIGQAENDTGYSVGILTLTNNTNLYLYVGGQGEIFDDSKQFYQTYLLVGGFNGGGNSCFNPSNGCGMAAGGGTDIRIGQDSLYARVIVAGGGGGSCYYYSLYNGGNGGGTNGGNGDGRDGSQTARGTSYFGDRADSTNYGNIAAFGQGGSAKNTNYSTIGGGGGWYGGGYGGFRDSSQYGAGGGGSGYVYTSSTASNYPSGCLLNSSYYLTDAGTYKYGETGYVGGKSKILITVIKGGSSLPFKIKVSNEFKDAASGYVKVGNTWKNIESSYVKVNGSWILC